MESSPACWAAYGKLLAREYSDIRYAPLHQLSVDAYAVQHPGSRSPQSIQSVGPHLISLCLTLEKKAAIGSSRAVLQNSAAFKEKLIWLQPPASRGDMTVANLMAVKDPPDHLKAVRIWAESAWMAWARHHAIVHGWIEEFGLEGRAFAGS